MGEGEVGSHLSDGRSPHHAVSRRAGYHGAAHRAVLGKQWTQDGGVIACVVDRRRPGPPQTQPGHRWENLLDAFPGLRVVNRVEVHGFAGLLVGIAHPPQQSAGRAGPPVDARGHIEHHRKFVDVHRRQRFGDHHLVAGATGWYPPAG